MHLVRAITRQVIHGLVLAIALSACTHRHTLTLDPLDLSELVDVPATVELDDGRKVSAQATQSAGGVVFIAAEGAELSAAAIRTITVVRHRRGALEGLIIGGGLGIVTGSTIGYLRGSDPLCQPGDIVCVRLSASTKAVIGGVLLGGLGAVMGTVFGASAGSRDVYELSMVPGEPGLSVQLAPGQVGIGLSWVLGDP